MQIIELFGIKIPPVTIFGIEIPPIIIVLFFILLFLADIKYRLYTLSRTPEEIKKRRGKVLLL